MHPPRLGALGLLTILLTALPLPSSLFPVAVSSLPVVFISLDFPPSGKDDRTIKRRQWVRPESSSRVKITKLLFTKV